jgi:hypothetical protein
LGRLFRCAVASVTAETPAHQLEVLLDQEAAAWRAVRAHVPGYNAENPGALEDLSLQQLVLVESFLAARAARRELLHPVVPEQSAGTPTSPGGQPIQ